MSERFTEDGRWRYRFVSYRLFVAARAPDGAYVTVLRIDLGPDGSGRDGHAIRDDGSEASELVGETTVRDHLSAARRAGLNLGDRRRVADAAASALHELGAAWVEGLGSPLGPDPLVGARIEAQDDPAVFDTVSLADGTLVYRRDVPGEEVRWVVVGWSNVSRARRWRPEARPDLPYDPTDYDPS